MHFEKTENSYDFWSESLKHKYLYYLMDKGTQKEICNTFPFNLTHGHTIDTSLVLNFAGFYFRDFNTQI